LNVADTVSCRVTVTTQVLFFRQLAASPPQPSNVASPMAVAVRVTGVPFWYAGLTHGPAVQSIPSGDDVTRPVPLSPGNVTLIEKSGIALKVAVTAATWVIVTMQVRFVPHELGTVPLHPANTDFVAADAVSVTIVPSR
jgi:hypothetical protein